VRSTEDARVSFGALNDRKSGALTCSRLTDWSWFVSNLSSLANLSLSVELFPSAMPNLNACPTDLYSLSYFSGSFRASLEKRSRDRLTSVRLSWARNLEEGMVFRETVRLSDERKIATSG
jgi:hypothetical protein